MIETAKFQVHAHAQINYMTAPETVMKLSHYIIHEGPELYSIFCHDLNDFKDFHL